MAPMKLNAPTKRNSPRILTTENNCYLKKIEQLANQRLTFLRDQELCEEQATQETKPVMRLTEEDVITERSKGKRPRSTSVGGELEDASYDIGSDDNKRRNNYNIKRRKVPKKAVRTAVVSNDVTERMKEFLVKEMKGTEVKVVIQKRLYNSDTIKSQNRLSMPVNQLETDEFLTAEEKEIVKKSCPKENTIEVGLVGPTMEIYRMKMELTMWHMATTMNYVLKTHWHQFCLDHQHLFEEGSTVQVWSFRNEDQQLCFAVACVDKLPHRID